MGDGPPLVLLPAGPGTSTTSWRYLVPRLSSFTCHLLDTRGRGASGAATDLTPDRLVEDVAAHVAAVGQPVGLLTWGSGPWTSVATAAAAGRDVEAARTFLRGAGLLYDDDDLASGLPERFWIDSSEDITGFLAEETAVEGRTPPPPEPAVLATVHQPVLLTRGSGSRPWFRNSVDHFAAHLPHASVAELPGAGHFAPWSAPEPLGVLVRQFVGSHLSGSA